MKFIIQISKIIIVAGLFGCLTSCEQEDMAPRDIKLNLGAFLVSDPAVTTRGELTINNITKKDFDIPFYIEMEYDNQREFGVYEVKEGNEAQLSSIDANEALNWRSTTADHTFYSWTLPWTTDSYSPGTDAETMVSFNQNDPMYSHLSSNVNGNCKILEKFIGTKAGPVNYLDNGEYVELQYQHLVSKIRINSLILIKANGDMIKTLSGKMTFLGMPETATFNPRPKDGGMPVVVANTGEDDRMEVTYNISSTSSSPFYVCPDVDYSDLQFKIHLDDGYSDEGDYYGNFSNVKFDREEYPGWDEGKSETKLYAGEIMNLNLTLTQGHGVGVTITIIEWQVDEAAPGKSYPHPGIYSDSQAQAVSDTFPSSSSSPAPSQEEIDEIFSLYGDEIDGKSEFPMYEDIELNQGSFNLGQDYTLNGMGHTLKMTPNSSTPHKVRVGNCRDIYITDGEYTVYIDPEGYIFKVDADGNLIPTGNQLKPLSGSKTNYQIDLTNGSFV